MSDETASSDSPVQPGQPKDLPKKDPVAANASDTTFPTQASGGGHNKGKPDGVSASPDPDVDVHGRTSGGESQGGAYPNPHTGKKPTQGGFLGHGGQTNMGYHGSGQAGNDGPGSANSTTRGDDDYSDQGQTGPKASPDVPKPE